MTRSSAAYTGLVVKPYDTLELEGDHRSMIKFSNRGSPGYRSVSERSRQFVARVMEAKHKEQEGMS